MEEDRIELGPEQQASLLVPRERRQNFAAVVDVAISRARGAMSYAV